MKANNEFLSNYIVHVPTTLKSDTFLLQLMSFSVIRS